ncbi:MAG: type II toxin-antitoxin system YafQ family toxin [Alloprevotella sp.]|nr:type II toxin-antitoxin system YafQ family toxin [Alloprevotella sp.]
MYEIIYTGQFRKSLKRCARRGLDIEAFTHVLDLLQEKGTLPAQYRPHKLQGKYKGCWECHINPDWLLIWEQNDRELILILIDTGSHADLF